MTENPVNFKDSLPPATDPVAREFMQIMFQKGPETLEERLTATYIRALKHDVFEGYRYHRYPLPPTGWPEDWAAYLKVQPDKRSAIWRELESRYSGFIKARDEARSANNADVHFLTEAYEHLKKVGALSQAEAYKMRLEEYAIEARIGC